MKLLALAPFLFAASAQAQSVLFAEDFEGGLTNWSATGYWNLQETSETCTTAQQLPFPSGTRCAWYGSPTTPQGCTYDNIVTPQYLTYLQPIVLPTTTGSITLSYQNWANVENSFEWDMHGAEVRVFGDTAWTRLKWSFNAFSWRLESRDLSYLAGQAIELRFSFIPIDNWGNSTIGVFLDDVLITEDPVNTPSYSTCGSGIAWHQWCPCGNTGGDGRGCASSLSATGAGMSGSGSLRLSSDTFALHMDGMSEAAATVFQASGFTYVTSDILAGDGVSCVNGSFIRLVTRYAPGGVLDFPSNGDSTISVLGLLTPGQTRYYAARYRDAGTFCSPATFNMTNTISAYWRP